MKRGYDTLNIPIAHRIRIRKRLFGIFTVRRKWLHKHALFYKCKVSHDWVQLNLLVEHSKLLNIAREKHSQSFLPFNSLKFSLQYSQKKIPSLAVKGGIIGTFCVIATANVSYSRLNVYYMHIYIYIYMHIYTCACPCIPTHICIFCFGLIRKGHIPQRTSPTFHNALFCYRSVHIWH